MKTATYLRLCRLHAAHGPRIFGKVCQKLVALAFQEGGCSHVVERGVQGVDIDAAWEGARVTEIAVSHHPRRFGKSKYGIGRVARVLLDLLIVYFIDRAFDRPIQFFGKLGLGFLLLSVAAFGWALVLKYTANISLIRTPLPLLAATAPKQPSTAVAIVFARDPHAPGTAATVTLRDLLGLTEAEAGLAQALQSGVALSDYARSRALSLNTVYTHLRRLREKTGSNRMAELIHKLNEMRLPLRRD